MIVAACVLALIGEFDCCTVEAGRLLACEVVAPESCSPSLLFATAAGSSAGATTGPKPPIDDKAGTARWIVANAPYAFIATQSSSMPGWPRNNVVSSANVTLPSSGRQVSALLLCAGRRRRVWTPIAQPQT